MSINLNTFWQTWGVFSGDTSAKNQYDFWRGLIMTGGTRMNNQYDFFTFNNTTRYEFFKNLNSTYPQVWDETTFYQNTNDVRIYDYKTFYEFGAQSLPTGGPAPTPTATATPTPTATPIPTATPTPTPTPVPLDPDAAAYLSAISNAGGTLDATISGAVDTLFVELKNAGIYSKLECLYPIVGSTASSHAFNALNPTIGDPYFLAYTAGWTHNVSGMSHSAGAYYANTNFVPSTDLATVESSMGYYISTTPAISDGYVMGAYNSGSQWWAANYQASNNFFVIHFQNQVYFNSLTKLEGFTQTSTSTTNRYQRFSNSIQTVTNTAAASGTRPNVSIYLGNLNNNGSAHRTGDFSPVINFAYIGTYLTATELGNFADIVQQFQTTLGRQV